ncbi:MAG: insulinase family protein [Gemmatimonadales bacterium]|nr:insulinase family protein [Gemmatimonadales bacterium]
MTGRRFPVMLALAAVGAPLAAQPPAVATAPAADGDSLPFDPAVVRGTLPNGLRYYLRRNSLPEQRVDLRLVVNAGSVLEDEDQRGLAHFVEHMAFNGTRRYAKNDLVKFLESVGVRFGADLNAYTSFDETVFYFPVPTDRPGLLEKGFEVLEDWAGGVLFDSLEVVNERGVVFGEWRDGRGAAARLRDRQFPVLFRGSRYGERVPIGQPSIIQGATPGPLRRFYRDWYRPDNMAVVAVGDADPARLEALVRKHFGGLRGPEQPRPRRDEPVPPHAETLVTIAADPEQPTSRVTVIHKRPARPRGTRAAWRAALVQELYDRMLNDRLAERTRRPDAPYVSGFAALLPMARTADAYYLSATAKEGGIDRALEALLTEARRVRVHGFLPSELARAKAAYLRAAEQAYAERDKLETEVFAGGLVQAFLSGEPLTSSAWDWETAQALVPGVTLEEVNARSAGLLTLESRVVQVQLPEKPGLVPPTEAGLLAVFARADTATVAPYTETGADGPLVAEAPAPGRVVRADSIPALGLLDWRLSNGVRVLVKPTDFKDDELLLSAWSPGGTSPLPDADALTGGFASQLVEVGGLGRFDRTQLQKRLAAVAASASTYIGAYQEGLQGQSARRDVEALLQLAHLRFTAPRPDSAAFLALRQQFEQLLRNRAASPEAAFADTVGVTLARRDPRFRPLTLERLAELDFGRAVAIYRDRFADAGDFTFLFVGAVAPDTLRPLVERWLGSLPATGRRDVVRPVGRMPPEGPLERVVRRGGEPKSRQVIVLSGPARYTSANRSRLARLAELLETRLLEELREALGGTYSVSVSGTIGKRPREGYQVRISFGSDPARADTMYRATLAVMERLRREGPTEEETARIREQRLRSLEIDVKTNGYWLGGLAQRLADGEDPRDLLTLERRVRELTPASLRAAARDFLGTRNVARFVLLPEAAAPPATAPSE